MPKEISTQSRQAAEPQKSQNLCIFAPLRLCVFALKLLPAFAAKLLKLG